MGPNRARLALLFAGGRPLPARAFAGGRPLPGRRVGESSSLDELRLEGEKEKKLHLGRENTRLDVKDLIFMVLINTGIKARRKQRKYTDTILPSSIKGIVPSLFNNIACKCKYRDIVDLSYILFCVKKLAIIYRTAPTIPITK